MKVQKKISAQGDFVKVGVDIKDGDLITILDKGMITSGEYGERNTFKIETPNGDKNMSFNQTSMNNLIDSYGEETENWVDKRAKVFIVKQMVSNALRNVAYLAGEGWVMDDQGRFYKEGTSPKVDNEEIPVVEE